MLNLKLPFRLSLPGLSGSLVPAALLLAAANMGAAATADLAIYSLEFSTNSVQAGQTVSCIVTVTNSGPNAAENVVIDAAPEYPLVPLSATASQGTVSGGFRCDAGTLLAGGSATVSLVAFAQDIDQGGIFSSVNSSTPDPEMEGNSLQAGVEITPGPGVFQFAVRAATNENAGWAILTVERLGGAVGPVQVSYHTENGSAVAGEDYFSTSGTLSFTNGQTTANFQVAIKEDDDSEFNETVQLRLANPTGGAVIFGNTNGTLWILDNDLVPSLNTLEAVSVTPGAAPVTGNEFSYNADVSADGRLVVFGSYATNLVAHDTDNNIDVFLRDRVTGANTLLSRNQTGSGSGNSYSTDPLIGADGQRVVFRSGASDLVSGDNNGCDDLFVYDVSSGDLALVTENHLGFGPGNGESWGAKFSADGNHVAFYSRATDLVAGTDDNNTYDVFLRDLTGGTTELISVNVGGSGTGNGSSFGGAVSGDGRYVAFESDATDLVSGDLNGQYDIFVRDTLTDTTTLVSINAAGTGSANALSMTPLISTNGRYVAFISDATDLVAGLPTIGINIYVRDLVAGTNVLVSVNHAGTAGGNLGSGQPLLSADGRFVAFYSDASDLVTNDFNGAGDVFVRDLVAGTTLLASQDYTGQGSASDESFPWSLSANGRYVVFRSQALNLMPGEFQNGDLFRFDRQTRKNVAVTRNALNSGGGDFTSEYPVINPDGSFIVFVSEASNLVTNDFNGRSDIFIWESHEEATVPSLTITLDSPSSAITVSWPAPAEGWVLERTNTLNGESLSWPQVPPPYQTNAGIVSVTFTNTPAVGNQFFRLHKP